MFQPETEEMLPRMAPKPSAAVPSGVSSEGIVRPQVPEVSILFGQQEGNLPQQTLNCGIQQQALANNKPQQTYAAWKKQMLPKVTYPAAAANMADMQLQENANNNMIMHDYNTPRTNLYPLRSSTTPALNLAPSINTNGFGGVTNSLAYRRSLESCSNNMAFQQMQHLPSLATQPPFGAVKPASSITNSRDILTICAGTQTDAIFESPKNYAQNMHSVPWSNLASKADVDEVREMLMEMRHEQQRIAKMMETLLLSSHQQTTLKAQSRDIGVQVECIETDNTPYVNDGIALFPEQPAPKNKFLQHLKPNNILQTPKGKPMAQSTTYRPNSPQSQPEVAPVPTYQQVTNTLPKSASDTSLAMNELALKYLPNEKLAELLKELNMDCPATAAATNVPTTPLRGNVDKFEKGPSDISNASYKYLKKYRLLPEDHEDDSKNNNNICGGIEREIENVNENQMPTYNSPQYNNIRNTPLNQRQTPTNKCSPYAGRLPLSPLARASPPPQQAAASQPHIVNLENIKHQPKFL